MRARVSTPETPKPLIWYLMNQSNFWWRRRLLYLQPEIKQTLLLNGASLLAAAPPSCAASAPRASLPSQELNAGHGLAEAINFPQPEPVAAPVPQMAANPFDPFSSAVMVEEPMPPTVDMRSEETKRLARISEEWFKVDDAPF